ncbi:hypothetical protein BP6252_07695 [Coleophoma cylindrospora]|uniref:Uncharacterized protein n=1 Tax=Coleophoma cylindrospora TaxID=1849047 RepID=A0A3D8RAQ0_9HELO|nr:hypothetical protein BP6252_07695 [Coleophoma cylindrospora]
MSSNNPPTATRRVLSALDVNATLLPGSQDPSKLSQQQQSSILTKKGPVAEDSSLPVSVTLSPQATLGRRPSETAGVVGRKRHADDIAGAEEESSLDGAADRSAKKSCVRSPVLEDGDVSHRDQDRQDEVVHPGECAMSEAANVRDGDLLPAMERSSSISSSPSSSFSFGPGLDDTQNTITTNITEPDQEPVAQITTVRETAAVILPPARTLTPAEIRQVRCKPSHYPKSCLTKKQKATAIRLRLGLASYKLRTNQLDVPLSRLQVRTMSSKFPPLPRLPPATTAEDRTTSGLSATRHNSLPEISARGSSFNKERHAHVSSSPPTSLAKHAHDPTTTPILPRQRHGLLNPPHLEAPIWSQTPEKYSPSGADLTSSVVKGRAADGLLSLMGARR